MDDGGSPKTGMVQLKKIVSKKDYQPCLELILEECSHHLYFI